MTFSTAEHIDATFDPITNRLYLMHYSGKGAGTETKNFLHVYQVAA